MKSKLLSLYMDKINNDSILPKTPKKFAPFKIKNFDHLLLKILGSSFLVSTLWFVAKEIIFKLRF